MFRNYFLSIATVAVFAAVTGYTFLKPDNLQAIQDSQVQVASLDAKCTGTIIDDEQNYILTAAHCLSTNAKQGFYDIIHREYKNGKIAVTKTYKAKVIKFDKSVDLMLMQLVEGDFESGTEVSISTDYKVGDPVFVYGNPIGLIDILTRGVVARELMFLDSANLKRPEMVIDALINVGNSGGGVFNESGELVGVLNISYARRMFIGMGTILSDAPYGMAVPSEYVLEFLEGYVV